MHIYTRCGCLLPSCMDFGGNGRVSFWPWIIGINVRIDKYRNDNRLRHFCLQSSSGWHSQSSDDRQVAQMGSCSTNTHAHTHTRSQWFDAFNKFGLAEPGCACVAMHNRSRRCLQVLAGTQSSDDRQVAQMGSCSTSSS
jgi:hypothetical protein